jgi:hypothetical protein
VEDQLAMIRPMLQLRGFIPAFPVTTGMMTPQGASQRYTLEQGVSYLITARCDAGCRAVDLSLFDAGGHLLQSDADGRDFPTMAFVPRESGQYQVTAHITQCASASCAYGIAVYRRDLATTEQMSAGKSR